VVHGKVVDGDESPVPGAVVTARRILRPGQAHSHVAVDAAADSQGRFNLELRKGRYFFIARSNELRSRRVERVVDSSSSLDLVVSRPTATLVVRLRPETPSIDVQSFSFESPHTNTGIDGIGQVRVRGLHVGETCQFSVSGSDGALVYPQDARLEGHVESGSAEFLVKVDAPQTTFDVRISRFATIEGRLLAPSGLAIVNARVESRTDSPYRPSVRIDKGEDGAADFRLRVLPNRRTYLYVPPLEPEGGRFLGLLASYPVAPIAPGERREIVIRLKPVSGVVRGVLVTSDREPVPAIVTRVERSARR